MTFKQLLRKYQFDDIIPELSELWDKGNLYLFRQAYDLLLAMEPIQNDGRNEITVHRLNNGEESYDRVCNLSGWRWDENLNWEISISPECNLSEKQLLALCLWERTYYGFSPQQESDAFEIWDKETDVNAEEKTETALRRDLIADICSKYVDIKPDDTQFLLADDELKYHTFIGLADSVNGDIGYIVESINKYSDLPHAVDKVHCIALVCMPDENTKTESHLSHLMEAVKSTLGCSEPIIKKRVSPDRNHTALTLLYI